MSIDWIPVRKILPKERGNRGIILASKVPNGIVEYESCLERDLYLLCNHAPSVKKYQHQPITIEYKDNKGKERKYTPDTYVEYINGKCGLYEIKYEEEISVNRKKYEKRWNAAEEWARKHGIEFAVLTEKEIRTARRENVWFTLGASKCSSNDKYMDKLMSLIPLEGEDYNSLCLRLSEELGVEVGKAAQIICYAIYYGLIFMDSFSTKQLSKDTILRFRKRENRSPFKPLWEIFELSHDNNLSFNKLENENSIKSIKCFSSNISFKYKEEVEKREEIVSAWLRHPSRGRTIEWRESFCNKWGISKSTVYRWVKAYEKDGRDGLIPRHKNKGRTKKYDKKTLNLIEKARNFYLKPRVTLKKAYRKLESLCKEFEIVCPPRSSFQWYVYQNTTHSELGKKRGKKYFKSHFTPSLASFQGANIPMQILQLDNTCFDVFPVDSEKRESLGTPYMTAAIDCYTRVITGFSVSLFPSSSRTILEVLVQCILPKDNFVKIYKTEYDWSISGFPVLILVDNGMDYRSQALKDFCLKYDIILEYAPIRTPRYKAFIEQWFNILHKALDDEDVPGTRPLLKDRLENPDLKPEADAVLTLQEIETWLHKWILDNYHLTNPYNEHILAPFLKWKDVQDGHTKLIIPFPREPPKDQREVDVMNLTTLDHIKRKLRYEGVVWEHLKYNSKDLARVLNVIGKKDVKVLLDRRDIRNVWVINPITEKPLKVGLASGWAQEIANMYGDKPISASAWIKEIRMIKRHVKTRITPYLYGKVQSRIERENILKDAKRKTKILRKEKEMQKEIKRKNQQNNSQKDDVIFNEMLIDDDYDDIYDNYQPSIQSQLSTEEDDIYESYKPKGLTTSRYPNKELRVD